MKFSIQFSEVGQNRTLALQRIEFLVALPPAFVNTSLILSETIKQVYAQNESNRVNRLDAEYQNLIGAEAVLLRLSRGDWTNEELDALNAQIEVVRQRIAEILIELNGDSKTQGEEDAKD